MMITEKEAAIGYAKAWNTQGCTEDLELLNDETAYSSHWVLDKLEGKANITEY